MRTPSRFAPVVRAWHGLRDRGPDRETVVQAAKMAVAALIAWIVAEHIHAPQSFIAPYAAVFVIATTVYRSLVSLFQQLTAVTMGVLLAYPVATTVPSPVFQLFLAVFVGMLVGTWWRLGDSGIWVGAVALLMITSGTADDPGYLFFRVVESLVGVSIGAAVNVFVFPPLSVRGTRRLTARAAENLTGLLRGVAAGLRDPDTADVARWRRDRRELVDSLRRAEDTAAHERESVRFNPRWRLSEHRTEPEPGSRQAELDVLAAVSNQTLPIVETLDLLFRSGRPGVPDDFAADFADLLDEIADLLDDYPDTVPGPEDTATVSSRLAGIRATRLHPGSGTDPVAPGSLLSAAERMLHRLGRPDETDPYVSLTPRACLEARDTRYDSRSRRALRRAATGS
ncbi:uncharacterized membrane protein YgaE (UPF0421/DUF939 family) [Stackebrandtia albiflava]|uniref:Uncharacterized membrane protein YgaE (UPF0421/DUF939 family) n=1 Tax=Stackebrandtia albiflava TaxID=406432 RepID=A0A562VCH3_9ACTN|nr:aromatic acid exporter family protein [Stackebrandtia albiflava]TWJ15576.1 uncharacterized membrane protein YgaE (UPF0421/DUF939 family) [Stackebrandtia albiflava]